MIDVDAQDLAQEQIDVLGHCWADRSPDPPSPTPM